MNKSYGLLDLKQYVSNLLFDFGRGYLKSSYIKSLDSPLKMNGTPTFTRPSDARPGSLKDDHLIDQEDVYVVKII